MQSSLTSSMYHFSQDHLFVASIYDIANAIAFVMGKNPGSTDEKSHIAVPREPEHDLISSDEPEGTPKQRECHKGSTCMQVVLYRYYIY